MEKLGMQDFFDSGLERFGGSLGRFNIRSFWEWEHFRKMDGAYKSIGAWKNGNLCTHEGLDHLLDVCFSADTPITSWFIAVFENNHTPNTGHTYAVPVYTECLAYDEATRPNWQEAGASSRVITNSATKASFTFNASKSIYGGALVGGGTDADTKGNVGGGGVLFCVSQFDSGQKAVVSTDVLKVSVTLTVADS